MKDDSMPNKAMPDEYDFSGYKLPVNPALEQGTLAYGFVTPSQDRIPQVASIPPRRALPIIFLPGTMGSNLRMSAARQKDLGRDNNLAWRPDHLAATYAMRNETAAQRQLRLDPYQTEVDTYDPKSNPTGHPNETSDDRNDKVYVSDSLYMLAEKGGDWPLLTADRPP